MTVGNVKCIYRLNVKSIFGGAKRTHEYIVQISMNAASLDEVSEFDLNYVALGLVRFVFVMVAFSVLIAIVLSVNRLCFAGRHENVYGNDHSYISFSDDL